MAKRWAIRYTKFKYDSLEYIMDKRFKTGISYVSREVEDFVWNSSGRKHLVSTVPDLHKAFLFSSQKIAENVARDHTPMIWKARVFEVNIVLTDTSNWFDE